MSKDSGSDYKRTVRVKLSHPGIGVSNRQSHLD